MGGATMGPGAAIALLALPFLGAGALALGGAGAMFVSNLLSEPKAKPPTLGQAPPQNQSRGIATTPPRVTNPPQQEARPYEAGGGGEDVVLVLPPVPQNNPLHPIGQNPQQPAANNEGQVNSQPQVNQQPGEGQPEIREDTLPVPEHNPQQPAANEGQVNQQPNEGQPEIQEQPAPAPPPPPPAQSTPAPRPVPPPVAPRVKTKTDTPPIAALSEPPKAKEGEKITEVQTTPPPQGDKPKVDQVRAIMNEIVSSEQRYAVGMNKAIAAMTITGGRTISKEERELGQTTWGEVFKGENKSNQDLLSEVNASLYQISHRQKELSIKFEELNRLESKVDKAKKLEEIYASDAFITIAVEMGKLVGLLDKIDSTPSSGQKGKTLGELLSHIFPDEGGRLRLEGFSLPTRAKIDALRDSGHRDFETNARRLRRRVQHPNAKCQF